MKLSSVVLFLLFVCGGAFAQETSETPQAAPSTPEATQPAPTAPEAAKPETAPPPEAAQPMPSARKGAEEMTAEPGDSVSVTEYYKQNVYDTSENTIGEVSDVLLDKDGHVTAVILSVGGFLGLGAKYVSVPFNALRMTEKDGKRTQVSKVLGDRASSSAGAELTW